MRDVLLLVDVLSDFGHEDGDRLARAFEVAVPALSRLLSRCREQHVPVVYANDHFGDWAADRRSIVARALGGERHDLIAPIVPEEHEPLLIKPGYSAFGDTPLGLVLAELHTDRILLCGTALEMCVAQTAIAARERGYKVSVMADACASIDGENAEVALAYLERVAGAWIDRT